MSLEWDRLMLALVTHLPIYKGEQKENMPSQDLKMQRRRLDCFVNSQG